MKYDVEIEIDLSRDRVVELFSDPDNMAKWQEGLVSFELLDGELGQPGTTSKLRYLMPRGNKNRMREVAMTETIVKNDLPDLFSATYEANSVWNIVEYRFEQLGPQKTRCRTHNEFKCSGVMKVLTFTMPGMFKKQSLKYLQDFKAFAEREG